MEGGPYLLACVQNRSVLTYPKVKTKWQVHFHGNESDTKVEAVR